MPIFKDYSHLINKKINNLVIIDIYIKQYSGQNYTFAKYKCTCGKSDETRISNIINGHTKSCGCIKYKHKLSKHGLYHVWIDIKDRCYNTNNQDYHHYGGRGIIVCDEWLNNFQAFYDWAINHNYKKGLTIDRKENNGNYEPNNCRFVNIAIQSRNKRNNRLLTIFNETKCVVEWAEDKRCVVSHNILNKRIWRNWEPKLALLTPVKISRKKNI